MKIQLHDQVDISLGVDALVGIQRGIEKEGLRVDLSGDIAQTPHAKALGSTLTHPSITTDYSESLLEFISPKHGRAADSISFLTELHRFTLKNLPDEVVWPASMPCRLDGDGSVPIAQYGSSNIGQMKHVYRQGLGVRYGRIMQSIAGIHYNFSLSEEFWVEYQKYLGKSGSLQDFKSAHYFTLIRNFRRNAWLLHYLFGASPVLDGSFLDDQKHGLDKIHENTYGLPYATSLRMSDLGYQNSAQEGLEVSYNSLDDYVETLAKAVQLPNAHYEEIGVKKGDQYQQLNANILQLENEYYSDIRPKRVTDSGEKPIAALRSRGVEYIEVRILDINPYLPVGIDETQINFLDAFLVYCLVSGCKGQTPADCEEIRLNQCDVINHGRDPDLKLRLHGELIPFKLKANDLLDSIADAAKLLDQAHSNSQDKCTDYADALQQQRAKVEDVQLTPSSKVMNEVAAGKEFMDLMLQQAKQHKQYFAALPEDQGREVELAQIAEQSLADQQELEESDALSFADFLDAYNKS